MKRIQNLILQEFKTEEYNIPSYFKNKEESSKKNKVINFIRNKLLFLL